MKYKIPWEQYGASRTVIHVNWPPVYRSNCTIGSICRSFFFTLPSLGLTPMKKAWLFQICNVFFQKRAHVRACYKVYESWGATSQWSLLLLLFVPYPLSCGCGNYKQRTRSVWIVLLIVKATTTAIMSETFSLVHKPHIHNREVFYCCAIFCCRQ